MLILVAVVCLVSGCPQPSDPQEVEPEVAADEHATFGALMRNQSGFYDELKRLQGLYTDPPNTAYAAPSNMDSRFMVSSTIAPGRVGLMLTDRESGEEWILWAWRDDSPEPVEISVLRDEERTSGYVLEYNLALDVLSVTITARWVQGRYLQFSRELMLGGLDHELWAPDSLTTWYFDGPWLPYRMLPSAQGPYGVVRGSDAGGQWHAQSYPMDVMVPAAAAYDRQQGFMLAVVDDHPRKLDRNYQVSWRMPPQNEPGQQLGLTYRVYDPTQDRYHQAYLVSGLPIRDSIVLEPFAIEGQSADATLVYRETAEVITRLGAVCRAFHFLPRPPAQSEPGSTTSIAGWISDPSEIPEFMRVATGLWDVRSTEAVFIDDALGVGGTVGLGALDLEGGSGLGEQALEVLAQIDSSILPVLAVEDYLAFHDGDAYHEVHPTWLAVDAEGGYFNKHADSAESHLLDIRNPQVAAWLPRKMASDIDHYQQVAGYSFSNVFAVDVQQQSPEQGLYLVSYPTAGCAVFLRTAEAVREARPDVLLAADSGLRLCLPAFCNTYSNGAGSFYLESSDGSPDSTISHANRLINMVCQQVFSVNPVVEFGENLATQVIATTPGVTGHGIQSALQQYAGFDAYVTHQRELRASGGELLVVHSSPAVAAYTTGGERPAECSELIALLPGEWDDAKTVWVAFHGIGGTVSVDAKNMLEITWNAGQWSRKLPVGYWVIEHPAPGAIQAGDAVLVLKKPIGTAPTGGASAS
jgi:hypothetical protein